MCASQKKKPDLMQSRCVLNKCGAGVGVDTTIKSLHFVWRKFTFLSLKCRGWVGGVTDLGLLTKKNLWPSLKGKAFIFAEKKMFFVSYTL